MSMIQPASKSRLLNFIICILPFIGWIVSFYLRVTRVQRSNIGWILLLIIYFLIGWSILWIIDIITIIIDNQYIALRF